MRKLSFLGVFWLMFLGACEQDQELPAPSQCIRAKLIAGKYCSTVAYVQVLNYAIGEKVTYDGKEYSNVIAINNFPIPSSISPNGEIYFNILSEGNGCETPMACPAIYVPDLKYPNPLPSRGFCVANISNTVCEAAD